MVDIKRTMLIALAAALLLSGCTADGGDAEAPEEPAAETPAPETTGPELSPEEAQAHFEAIRPYLPVGDDYLWVYNGFAEYGHRLRIDQRLNREDSIRLVLAGTADDASGEADPETLSFSLEYLLEEGRLVQRTSGPSPLMDRDFRELVLLAGPLEEGAQFTQTQKTWSDETVELVCTIESVDEDGTLTVRYADANGDYYETRTFKPGVGVANYAKLHFGEEQDFEMGYALYREASGYPLEREVRRWLPPRDVTLLYYGLAEYAHRATLADVSFDERGRTYTVRGDFEYDGSGIPGDFRVAYRIDGVAGTITERVLENTRAERPELNSAFSDLIVLKSPFTPGTSWTQTTQMEGEETLVSAKVTGMKLTEDGARRITVRYETPREGYHEGVYFETRTFEEGRGLVGFSSLLPGPLPLEGKEADDPQAVQQALANHQFGYAQNPIER